MPDAIDVKDLTKKFGTTVAVDNISFSVQEGEIFGFLGQDADRGNPCGSRHCHDSWI